MQPEITDQELNAEIAERFKQLPIQVRNAITSADIEEHLRELAKTHQLHLDQWQLLENEVMLTLLGFKEPKELGANLEKDLDITGDVARSLAEDVSHIVFEPIRTELEHQLGSPQEGDPAETIEARAAAPQKPAPVIVPATPPPSAPTERSVRAPISASYSAGQASHERKVVEGDPYREQLF